MGSHNILIEAEWGPPHPGPYLFFPHQGGRAGSSICLWGNISLSGCLREGEHLQGREPLSSRAEVMVRENGGLGAFTWPWPCWGEEFSPTWLPKDELEGRRRVLLSVKARHNWPELGLLYKFLSLIKCSFKTFLKPTSPATKKSGRHEPLARGCSGAALQGHQHWGPKTSDRLLKQLLRGSRSCCHGLLSQVCPCSAKGGTSPLLPSSQAEHWCPRPSPPAPLYTQTSWFFVLFSCSLKNLLNLPQNKRIASFSVSLHRWMSGYQLDWYQSDTSLVKNW